MTKKNGFSKDQKEELAEFFASAFREVAIPAIETAIETAAERLREDIGDRIEKLDSKLVHITDHHGDKLDNHEKRIKKLEAN